MLAVSLSPQLISIITFFPSCLECDSREKNTKKKFWSLSIIFLSPISSSSVVLALIWSEVVKWSGGMYKGIKINCFMGDICMLFAFSLSPPHTPHACRNDTYHRRRLIVYMMNQLLWKHKGRQQSGNSWLCLSSV